MSAPPRAILLRHESRSLRHPHRLQPAAPLRGREPVHHGSGARRGPAPRGRGVGRRAGPGVRRDRGRREAIAWGDGADEHRRCCAPSTATGGGSTRSSSTRPGTGCWARRSSTGCTPRPGATRARAPRWPGRPGSMLWTQVEAGARLPGQHDLRGRARPAGQPRAGRGVGAPAHRPGLRAAAGPGGGQGGGAVRHGHDREAGRPRRAGQHHRGPTRAARTGGRCSPGTSGSARPR